MQTVLVGTDFSETAANAVDYAGGLSAFLGARLIIVHAYSFAPIFQDAKSSAGRASQLREDLLERLEKEKKRLITKIGFDPGIEIHIARGGAIEVLENYCDIEGADLIVAGTHGSTSNLTKLLGSTALELSERLRVPTLLVPLETKYHNIKRITFACDYRFEPGSTVVEFARATAHTFGAVLELLNVTVGIGEREFVPHEAQAIVEKKLEHTEHVTILLHNDDVTESLIKYLKKSDTDILLLQRKKHGLLDRLFGQSVTSGVVDHVKLPVLIVK